MFTLLYANSESFAAVLSNTRSRQTVWQYANMRVAKQTLIFTLTQFRARDGKVSRERYCNGLKVLIAKSGQLLDCYIQVRVDYASADISPIIFRVGSRKSRDK